MFVLILKKILLDVFFSIVIFFPTSTLSVGFLDQPTSFLPNEVKTDSEHAVSDLLFRKLFKYDEGKLVPDLIDSWESLENDTKYKLKLKNNLKWQDGTKITSDDILYSLTLRDWLRNEIEIEKISDIEVLVTLPSSNAILPSLLTFGIEPSHLRGQSPIKPIGSSSYRIIKVIRERDQVSGVVLQSMKKDKPYRRLVVRFYNNENDLVTAYDLGEISVFLSKKDIYSEGLKRRPLTYIGRYYTLLFNLESKKLTDVNIRKKLSSAINVESFLEKNNYVNNVPVQGVISFSPYTKAPEDIGIVDKKILSPSELDLLSGIKIILPNNQDGIRVQKMLDESWGNDLGIALAFEFESEEEILKRGTSGNFDVLFIGHEVTPDPDRYSLWHSTQIGNGLNFGRLSDLRADKALEEGRKTSVSEERKKHYNILQDVFVDKVPAVFLYHPGEFLYMSKSVQLDTPKLMYYPSEILKNL